MTQRQLVSLLDAARLTGRGGAGFPAAAKIAAITGKKAVVVANGAEGEPLSEKDAVLLTKAPHLVFDGLELTARAIRADKVYVYVPRRLVACVNRVLGERGAARAGRYHPVVVEAPDGFVAGEESAVVRRIEGGPALPRDRTVVAAKSGVRGRPTLVNNVETLAHIALIARFGAEWFSAVGDRDNPGTMLVTLSGALAKRGVGEVPTAMPLIDLVEHAGSDPATVRAILVGGYHGRWVPADAFATTAASGAGIVHALGVDACGLARTAAIVNYLAGQSARQCGPCLTGLPRLAELFGTLAECRGDDTTVPEIRRLVGLVDGRGACRHPDGTARLVRSALDVFAEDVELHRRQRCEAVVAARSERTDVLPADTSTA